MAVPIDITFLGTGSAQPSATRNHQAIAFRANGDIWLFDAGEATQHQFQRSALKMGRVTKIFITHLHGDHCFGLAPLLCSMTDNLNANRVDSDSVVDVYGPSPLRRWLRTTLLSTYSRLGRKYRVHELLLDESERDNDTSSLHPDEDVHGKDIVLPKTSGDGYFRLPEIADGWSVLAAPIKHSIPSLGFVIQEPDLPGKLDQAALLPLIHRNAEALRQERGFKNPLQILGELKKSSEPIQLPDGTILHPPETRQGRQIVILGDTCDATSMLPLLKRPPDVLVHEATNALTSLDPPGTTYEEVLERTLSHGHSTPQMAATLARDIGAKTLLMTHFSVRYKGNEEGFEVMEEIRKQAVQVLGEDRDCDVYCARDFWSFDVKIKST